MSSASKSSPVNTPYRLFIYKLHLKKSQKKKRSNTILCEAKIYLTEGLVTNCIQDAESRIENFENLTRSIEYKRSLQKTILRLKPIECTRL